MKIVKGLRILKIGGAFISNAPYKLILHDLQLPVGEEGESSVTLDTETAVRHDIPLSFDLVGRTLICSLESRDLFLKDEKHVDWETIGGDDVVVESLEKRERVRFVYFQFPPGKNTRVSRVLELTTQVSGDRYDPLPCPCYHFFLELTDKEYRECKALPANTVFHISFSLKEESEIKSDEQGAARG